MKGEFSSLRRFASPINACKGNMKTGLPRKGKSVFHD
jgi:hypothetical protein